MTAERSISEASKRISYSQQYLSHIRILTYGEYHPRHFKANEHSIIIYLFVS